MTQAKKSWAQAPHSRRPDGTAAGRGGALDWHSRPGRSQDFADQAVHACLASVASAEAFIRIACVRRMARLLGSF